MLWGSRRLEAPSDEKRGNASSFSSPNRHKDMLWIHLCQGAQRIKLRDVLAKGPPSIVALNPNKEALKPFMQSERIALKTQHYEGATSAAHNRALALEAIGQVKASERVLIKRRNDSERHQLWCEYV